MASRLSIYAKDARFIIVLKKDGINNFLQYRNVISWYFYNNRIKAYKTYKSAKKKLETIMAKHKGVFSDGYVIFLHVGENITTDNIKRYINSDRKLRHI